jgi:hypothetical protein
MMLQRVAAFLMLAVQACAIYSTFGRIMFPVAVTVIALAGLPGKIEFNPTMDRKIRLTFLLALVFALEWLFFRPETQVIAVVYTGEISYPVAQFCLAVQAAMFFLRYDKGLPLYMLLYGTAALTWTGDVMVADLSTTAYGVGVFCYGSGAAAFIVLGQTRWSLNKVRARLRYVVACAAALAVSIAMGWTVTTLIREYQVQLDDLFVRVVAGRIVQPRIGFPSSARLDSVANLKRNEPTEVALRVVADQQPGYLRGRGFDTLAGDMWSVTVAARHLSPRMNGEKLDVDVPSGCKMFELGQRDEPLSDYADVYPVIDPDGALFASMQVLALASPADMVLYDQNSNMQVSEPVARARYRVYDSATGGTVKPLEAKLRLVLTHSSADIDPRVRELATRIFTGCTTTTEKIAAVVGHFRQNYTYKIGISIPPGEDPLTYFLVEQPPPPAHCEYFAAGAAVLLRLADVPTRYVTGFVAAERNPVGGYWIARNSDAHAWVEAYDDEDGWTLVEATVADGIPGDEADRRQGWLAYVIDSMKFRLGEMASIFSLHGLLGLFRHLVFSLVVGLFLLLSPGVAAFLLAVVAAVFGLRWFRRRSRSPREEAPPLITALNKLLRTMDRHLGKSGFYRTPAETLHGFARRIENALPEGNGTARSVDWYRRYAGLRYSTALTEEDVTELQRSLDDHLRKD